MRIVSLAFFATCIISLVIGLIACSNISSPKPTLERFLTAYKNEQWDICKSLGTGKTKSLISLMKNIQAKYTEKEMAVYNSQKMKEYQIQTMQESADSITSAVLINNNIQRKITMVRTSNGWFIHLESPLL